MADDPNPPDDDEVLPDETEDENEGQGENARLDDDESGDETEAGQESEGAEAQERVEARPRSRATQRVQEATRIAREASERSQRLERELAEMRAERARSQVESPEAEAVRLATMTVEERVDYKLNKAAMEHQRQIGLMQFTAADSADKAGFAARAAYDPRYKRYAKEVEDLLMSERRAGRDFPRETILKFVIGQKVMEARPAASAQRQAGQARIQRQTTNAPRGGSDRQANRGRVGQGNTLSDLEKRLDGVFI